MNTIFSSCNEWTLIVMCLDQQLSVFPWKKVFSPWLTWQLMFCYLWTILHTSSQCVHFSQNCPVIWQKNKAEKCSILYSWTKRWLSKPCILFIWGHSSGLTACLKTKENKYQQPTMAFSGRDCHNDVWYFVSVYISPHWEIMTAIFGLLFGPVGTFSIFLNTSNPSITRPAII